MTFYLYSAFNNIHCFDEKPLINKPDLGKENSLRHEELTRCAYTRCYICFKIALYTDTFILKSL